MFRSLFNFLFLVFHMDHDGSNHLQIVYSLVGYAFFLQCYLPYSLEVHNLMNPQKKNSFLMPYIILTLLKINQSEILVIQIPSYFFMDDLSSLQNFTIKSSINTCPPMRGKSVDFVVMAKEFFKGELLFMTLFFNTCQLTSIFPECK